MCIPISDKIGRFELIESQSGSWQNIIAILKSKEDGKYNCLDLQLVW